MKTIMIVTGESSGELYGSLLAKALKSRFRDLRILGIGGDRMGKAGVELISGISGAFGLAELVSSLRDLKIAFQKTKTAIRKSLPQVLVLIDFPDFNIKVAEFAKSLGIKILYYVSPQVWAWRRGRIKKLAGLVDRMAVVLPFETEIYKKAGVPCEFVGHPIVEEIETVLQSTNPTSPPFNSPLSKGGYRGVKGGLEGIINPELRTDLKTSLGFDAQLPLLSLLPGSRSHELKRLLPLMIDVIKHFKKEFMDYQLCIPIAPNTDEEKYSHYLSALSYEGAVIKKGESIRALAASDMAVIASGTATLQAALLEVPMVVIYKLSPFTYFLGKFLINIKHISLVNILSGREVVPELIQQRASPEGIIKELKKIMADKTYKKEMISYYRLIKKLFGGLRASQKVTDIIGEMAGWEH
jgi:lipid-A-disaccharide synthase